MNRIDQAVILVLTTLILTACGPATSAPDPEQSEQPPASVTTQVVESGNAVISGRYTARVHGSREVEVRARVDGILEERLYEEGSPVEAGDPLFRIDPRPRQVALQAAQAAEAEALARRAEAQRERDRARRLLAREAISEQARDQAVSALELAEAAVQAARARIAEAELMLEYTTVAAPVGGITGLEAVSEGTLLSQGSLLTHITRHDPADLYFSVPADQARSLRSGSRDTVTIRLPDGRRLDRAATISFVGSRVDPSTNTVRMRATTANPDGTLIPGELLDVELPLERMENAILVEPRAISEGPDGPRVFVARGNTAHSVTVQPGRLIDGRQEVTGDLQPGDQLIVSGHVALQDGAAITVQGGD